MSLDAMAQSRIQLAIRELCAGAGEVAASLDQRHRDLSALHAKVPRDQLQAHSDIEHWKENFQEWALSLRVWVDNINNGPHNSQEPAMQQVQRHLKLLRDREKLIKGPLGDRLHYGRFATERKRELARTDLQKLLRQIQDTLWNLQNLTPTIIGAAPEQSPETILCNQLTAHLEGIAKGERPRTLIGTVDVLWDRIEQHPDLSDHLGNSIDPGDGIFYRQNEDFDRAKSVLGAFVKACKASWAPGDWPGGLDSLPGCAKICVILKHLGFEKVLDEFLYRGWTDTNLPFTKDQLDEISKASDIIVFSSNFIAEQYRAVPRIWPSGIDVDMIELHDREPHPFKWLQRYGEGDFGMVTKVMDVFTQEKFALKSPVDDDIMVQTHFSCEIQRLRKLHQHKHIVKLVKYFRRRGRIYILVHKGDENLDTLLQRYHRNDWNPSRRVFVRKEMEDVLPKVFGCLSRGLQYVHANEIRHKDIKPHNILRQHVESTDSHNFFWIDFGVADDFSADLNSHNKKQLRYTKRYAAPEVMRAASNLGMRNEPDLQHFRSRDEDDRVSGIGRAADIFSLGLMFLEVLSVMLGERYPAKQPSIGSASGRLLSDGPLPGSIFQACIPFHMHTSDINKWAKQKISDLATTQLSFLIPVFEVCLRMIRVEAKSRLTIDQVVESLAAMENGQSRFFCTDCEREMENERENQARARAMEQENNDRERTVQVTMLKLEPEARAESNSYRSQPPLERPRERPPDRQAAL